MEAVKKEPTTIFSGVMTSFFSFKCFAIVVSVFMPTEIDSKLQSAEARCKVLEKQLDYMRKMVENAKKEKNALMEDQVVKGLKLRETEYLNIILISSK